MNDTLLDALTDTEQKKVHTPDQEWSDAFAFKVAKADFETAANYRAANHDERWKLADTLYAGWEKQRHWEGSKIPRSSLGMFVVFSQIESMLPKVLSSLFADNPWFEVGGEPGTAPTAAMDVRDLMLYQMEQMRRVKNQSIREVFRRAIKDSCLYGIGPVEMGWMDVPRKKSRFVREQIPVTRMLEHPQYGAIELPTGDVRTETRQIDTTERRRQPYLRHVSAKDVFVDPNHTNPQFQDARYVCTRGYRTVDELEAMRKMPGFTLPPRARLLQLAQSKPARQADSTKMAGEVARGANWQPTLDTSADPGAGRIEVIARISAERVVWILNGEELAYNAKNEFGFINVFNVFYVDFPGRAYGMSVSDVTEGEHRLQGALVNAMIDEQALYLHGRTVRKRGKHIPAHQLRRRPGQQIEAENPKEDVIFDNMQPQLTEAHIQVQASENRTQKTTGLNDLIASGVPGSGGNSANRTAAGINVQASAGMSRLGYQVENTEDTFVEPILYAWHTLNTLFLDPEEAMTILAKGPQGQMQERQIDVLNILNADVLFKMRASSKMQSRQALLQTFPLIAQTFMNPELISTLHRQGMTFDMAEMAHMVLDMTGYKARGNFIRPLTPEEQQALQQASQQEQNVELVKQRERMTAMKEMQDSKAMDDIQKAVVERGLESALEPEETEA